MTLSLRFLISLVLLYSVSLLLEGCFALPKGGGAGDSAGTITITPDVPSASGAAGTAVIKALSSLPNVTGPVKQASLMRGMSRSLFAATTGTKLSDWNSKFGPAANGGSGDAGTSRAMCEVGNMTSGLLFEAATSDFWMCEVGVLGDAGILPAGYDDGSTHYFGLIDPGSSSIDLKLKFQVQKGSDGSIQTLKMWTCAGPSATSNDTYMGIDLSGGASGASVVSVSNLSHSISGIVVYGLQRTTAIGNIDSSGAWTSKVITSSGKFHSSGASVDFTQGQHLTFTQYPDHAILDGFFDGSYGSQVQSGQVYADYAVLNSGTLASFAIGNGSLNSLFQFDSQNHSGTVGWNGDDETPFADPTTSDYYSAVNGHSLQPIDDSKVDVEFQPEETWDCQVSPSQLTTISLGDNAADYVFHLGMVNCANKLGLGAVDSGWVSCGGSLN